MLILLQRRRLTSLIVFLAILLNLCAPALSQAMTVLSADPLAMDICSASRATANDRAPASLPAHHLRHCLFCAAHSGGEAPLPAAAGLLTISGGHDAYPSLPVLAQAHSLNWTAAQPRGPPVAA